MVDPQEAEYLDNQLMYHSERLFQIEPTYIEEDLAMINALSNSKGIRIDHLGQPFNNMLRFLFEQG